MKTLLIPVDFSENTLVTCKYAIQLASEESPVKLHLLHIYPDQLMIPDSSFPSGIDSDAFMNMQFVEELRTQSQTSMKHLLGELETLLAKEKLDHILVTNTISGGDPEWEIRNQCNEIRPEVIVMGTHGTGKKGFLEGSMASKIMDHASVPVIAVPESVKSCEVKHVLYISKGHDSDFGKIMLLFRLFKREPIEVSVVQFADKGRKSDAEAHSQALKESFNREKQAGKLSFYVIDADDKQAALEAMAEHQQVSMVAFITHRANIFKSLFSHDIDKKDYFKLNLPMLAMHEK